MKWTSVALLIFGLPFAAAAQRLELAALVGGYQSSPRSWTPRDAAACTPDFEPCIAKISRAMGSLVGGRLTLNVGRHFGIDGTVQSGRAISLLVAINALGGVDWSVRETVATTALVLQPKLRLRLDGVELAVAAGPAISIVRVSSDSVFTATHSRSRLGIALSGGMRARVARGLTAELRSSYAVYLPERELTGFRYVIQPPERPGQNVREWSWSVGLGYALNR